MWPIKNLAIVMFTGPFFVTGPVRVTLLQKLVKQTPKIAESNISRVCLQKSSVYSVGDFVVDVRRKCS